MVARWLAVFATLLLVAACAAENERPPVSSMKVDLEQVVKVGRVIPVGGITTAGQPDEAALAVFRDNGYVAVIDLRSHREERGFDEVGAIALLRMNYVRLPIVHREDVSFSSAKELDSLINAFDGPVLIHCGSGNRVGALLALRASLAGADDEAAIEFGKQAGLTSLEEVVRERLAE